MCTAPGHQTTSREQPKLAEGCALTATGPGGHEDPIQPTLPPRTEHGVPQSANGTPGHTRSSPQGRDHIAGWPGALRQEWAEAHSIHTSVLGSISRYKKKQPL